MAKSTCCTQKCERQVHARGMCSTHWSQWYRANRKQEKQERTCEWCGESYKTARSKSVMCSLKCASGKAASLRPPKKVATRRTEEELQQQWAAQRSELRAAYEDARWRDFIIALRERVSETQAGCWEWQGKTKQAKKSSTPYPIVRWANKYHQVHRLALEAKHGRPLGGQQSHHTCANTLCVNPAHLQAATHIENIAEMKARRSYVLRIAELEEALRAVSPDHEALNRISYGSQWGA